MKSLKRELVSGAAASALLVGLAVFTNLAFPVLLGISAAAYVGVRMVVPGASAAEVAEGISRVRLEETVRDIRAQAARFDHFGDRHKNPMRKQLRRIAQLTRDINGHLKRDPSNVEVATEFLEVHLPKSLRIVENFTVLSEQDHLDEEGRQRLAEAEKTIGLIEKTIAAQHARMLKSDVEAMDMDRRVYEELLRLDGEVDRWADDDFESVGRRARREAEAPDGSPPGQPTRDP
ncbi:MAG: 5-bromo-4-chloroindolyl phosphate hydrolysis family protein [Acidobacteriota bacterium]